MEDTKELYYEANAIYGDDVKRVYEEAVTKNAKFYRAKSKSGLYFGWNGDRFVRAGEGQEWFENPEYKAEEFISDDTLDTVKNTEQIVEDSALIEETITSTDENADNEQSTDTEQSESLDFEMRIEELDRQLAEKAAALDEKNELLENVEHKLSELKDAVKVIINFIEEV